MKIVVARYHEDISWLDHINGDKLVLEKGNLTSKFQDINLPNVGRESHSYLYYITNEYNNLEDYTCFLQGNPFPHCADIINAINNFKYDTNFLPFGDIYNTVKDACPHHSDLVVSKYDDLVDIPSTWDFHAGAQFIVHKDVIQQHSLSFYQELFNRHITDYHAPWCMERIWKFIFKYVMRTDGSLVHQ